MLENVKDFVSEKMEKVEDFISNHYYTILATAVVVPSVLTTVIRIKMLKK